MVILPGKFVETAAELAKGKVFLGFARAAV